MKHLTSYRIIALIRWVCVWMLLFSRWSPLTLDVAAQEPTSEPTVLPTPTPAPTWTPTPTPINTPGAATPTTPSGSPTATPSGRLVDFRVDEDKVKPGDCVTFSWVVRGDLDRVEFDVKEDGKVAVLVSDMDSREECPSSETKYELTATWLDGTRTARTIKVEVDSGGDGDSGSGDTGSATPAGTAVFVPVTPIPFPSTPVAGGSSAPQPVSQQSPSGSVSVAPVGGALSGVRVLPETGHRSPPSATVIQLDNNPAVTESQQGFWLILVAGLILFLGMAIIALAASATEVVQESEDPR